MNDQFCAICDIAPSPGRKVLIMTDSGPSGGRKTAWAVVVAVFVVVAGFVGSLADVVSLLESVADKGIVGLLQALGILLVIAGVLTVGGWAWHRNLLSPRRLFSVLVVVIAVGITYVVVVLVQRADDVTVEVYNKVTDGATRMREDRAAYLSSRTQNHCRKNGCAVPGPDLHTGSTVDAYCQTTGDVVTNEDRTSPADDANPEVVESPRWYGVRNADGEDGYLSEVWVIREQRGGLGLTRCEE